MKYLPLLLLSAILVAGGCGSPKNIEIYVEAPLEVDQGEEFTIVAGVRNNAAKTQTLVSLDIGDRYLEGIAIVGTTPEHKEATHIPLDNTMSYDFQLPIEPGDKVEIIFDVKALKQGDFNSEIDFCINSEFSFLTKGVRTIVK